MSLSLLDENQDPLSNPFHAYVDGVSGGVYEFQIFVVNDDTDYYYTGVRLDYTVNDTVDWYDPETSRINVRMFTPASVSQTGTRPTNTDWLNIQPDDTLFLPDIGEAGAGTLQPVPVWIRLFIPPNTEASTLTHGLRLRANELVA